MRCQTQFMRSFEVLFKVIPEVTDEDSPQVQHALGALSPPPQPWAQRSPPLPWVA